MNNNKNDLKEKFKQALISTAKVISDDYSLDIKDINKKIISKSIKSIDINDLSSKSDFTRLRAEMDSSALKKKFSDQEIYNKNLPNNSSCKLLYSVAERIRYEVLGGKMLKGIKKNFNEDYHHKINLKHKDQLRSKKDVQAEEAFELYMLKKFLNIKLNPLTTKMLNFWEKDFETSIGKHIEFLNKNLENQNNYSLKLSKILQEMDIFNSEDDEIKNEKDDKENEQEGSSDNKEDNQSDKNEEKNTQDKSQTSLSSSYDIDKYQLDEQLSDSESLEHNSENISQKEILN